MQGNNNIKIGPKGQLTPHIHVRDNLPRSTHIIVTTIFQLKGKSKIKVTCTRMYSYKLD